MEKSMNHNQQQTEFGATLLEILIASAVFIIVLILSLGAATEFSKYGNQVEADAGSQIEVHRAFTRMEQILRQGWSKTVTDSEGEEIVSKPNVSDGINPNVTDGIAVTVPILGYKYDTGSESWEQIPSETWRREYDLDDAEYYFTDSNGGDLPVAYCTIYWDRLSTDPGDDLYHFGNLICWLSVNPPSYPLTSPTDSWTLARQIGTLEVDSVGQRLQGIKFTLNANSVDVELHLQRTAEDLPYSLRSKIRQRNFVDNF